VSAPDLNPCACCRTSMAPTLTDTATSGGRRLAFGVWVMCPSCEAAGPRTWVAFEDLEEAEMAAAQSAAAQAWNRIQAAVRTVGDMAALLVSSGADRTPSLRGRVG